MKIIVVVDKDDVRTSMNGRNFMIDNPLASVIFTPEAFEEFSSDVSALCETKAPPERPAGEIEVLLAGWRPGDSSATIPRRNRLDLNSPTELAIREAMMFVEKAGADPLLTEAIVLLGQAREKVSDFVDSSLSSGSDLRSLK